MKVHTEVLIHVGVYAELVLDHKLDPTTVVFDPLFRDEALDATE